MVNPFKSCFQDGTFFPITDMSRPGEGAGHAQVTAGSNPAGNGLARSLSWPRHQVVAQDYGLTPSASCAHRSEALET
jgi:hypothetical protein